jgi:hypothetical protein
MYLRVAKTLLKLVIYHLAQSQSIKKTLYIKKRKKKEKKDNVVLIKIILIIIKNYNKKEESIKLFIITLMSKE